MSLSTMAKTRDGGEPLADGVDLHDVCAAGQQLPGDVLQLPTGDQRLLEQGAAAAGEEKQHRVRRRQIPHQRQGLPGPGEGIFIGDRMPRLPTGKIGDRAHAVAVFRHHHTCLDAAAQAVVGGLRHLPGGLSGGHQHHPAGKFLPLQGPCHRIVRLHGPDGIGHDFVCDPAQMLIHPTPSPSVFCL